MPENAPTVYLFPDNNGVVPLKKKGGCPFGYTSETPLKDVKSPFDQFNF